MRLKILLPSRIFIDREVLKVTADAVNGSFCLLPKHIDMVTVLVPGLLSFHGKSGREEFIAVDEGILVKCGQEVFVSTRQAVQGPNLGDLRKTIQEQFQRLDEGEKKARSALAKLEADFIRQFLNWGK